MGRNGGSKSERRARTVSVKDDPESEETQMSLEADSTQPGPDTEEKTGSPDKEKLAEDFVEGLSKTGMPLRFMSLDDSERCPVRLISGMMKSKARETGQDEAPKEYTADKERYTERLGCRGPFMSGSRSAMKICTTCHELYGYTVDNEKILYQECYCKNKPETPLQKGDWSRFDYEQIRELCYCCGRQMIRCGSKYSRFHCDACHEQIVSLNKRCGIAVIPIGRHSVMNGVFMDNTVQRNEKEVARFCTRMIGLFDKIGRACMWKKHIISENIKKAGFTDGLDVEVEDYLQKVSLLPHDCVANMECMADFVCSTEPAT